MHRFSACERVLQLFQARCIASASNVVVHNCIALLAAIAMIGLMAATAHADDYYNNKQIKLIVGTDVGGSYDVNARLVARHLAKHIPGNPQILVQNMPGASSIIAANYINEVAPQDGSVIAAVVQTLLQSQFSGDKLIKFDSRKLNWIGNPSATANVIVTWHDSPVKTIDDARRTSIAIGLTSAASSGALEIALTNNLLGTLFKPVTGYKGGNELDIAMERGEVLGRAGQSWSGWKQTRPDWVRDKKLNILAQIGPKPDPDLPDVPLLSRIPTDPDAKQLIELYSDTIAMGRPLVVGPQVPAERVAILRNAFRDLMGDKDYQAEAKKIGIDVQPIYGEELQKIVEHTLSTPSELIAKFDAARTLRSP